MLSKEEYAGGTRQRSNYARAQDAHSELKMEECVNGIGQRSNCAALKDAQIKLRREESVRDMVENEKRIFYYRRL
eukprot:scaffold1796_cov107-Skeletonema_dohrnii-CCMP3373.AAC.5